LIVRPAAGADAPCVLARDAAIADQHDDAADAAVADQHVRAAAERRDGRPARARATTATQLVLAARLDQQIGGRRRP
jgi:hypothetical protein